MTFTNLGTKCYRGFPVQGWTKEGLECKNHGDMGVGGVGEGTLVEGCLAHS